MWLLLTIWKERDLRLFSSEAMTVIPGPVREQKWKGRSHYLSPKSCQNKEGLRGRSLRKRHMKMRD